MKIHDFIDCPLLGTAIVVFCLALVARKVQHMFTTLQDLSAAFDHLRQVVGSHVDEVKGLRQQVADLTAKVDSLTAAAPDLGPLKSEVDDLAAQLEGTTEPAPPPAPDAPPQGEPPASPPPPAAPTAAN